jgi:hypothetical protein
MKAGQEWMIAKMDAHQERMDSHHEKMMAIMEACLAKMEAVDLEENPDGIKSESEQQEVPKVEAAVKTIRALKDQYGDQHLAMGCHRQPKKWTQGDGRSGLLPFLHRARDTLARDQTGTVLQEKLRKGGRFGRDVGRAWNATMA